MKSLSCLRLPVLLFCGFVIAACSSGPGGGGEVTTGPWNRLATSYSKNGMIRTAKTTAGGHVVEATMVWRPYRAATDGSVASWYGDMGRPPPIYVVQQLTISVNGNPVSIPPSAYRSYCTQWEPLGEGIEFFKRGSTYRLLLSLGDGAEAWAGYFDFVPGSPVLKAQGTKDGPELMNEMDGFGM